MKTNISVELHDDQIDDIIFAEMSELIRFLDKDNDPDDWDAEDVVIKSAAQLIQQYYNPNPNN